MAEGNAAVEVDDQGRPAVAFVAEVPQTASRPRVELRFANIDGALVCMSVEIGAPVRRDGREVGYHFDIRPRAATWRSEAVAYVLERITTARLRQVNLAQTIDAALFDRLRDLQELEEHYAPSEEETERRLESVDEEMRAALLAGSQYLPMLPGIRRQKAAAEAAVGGKRRGRPPLYDDAHFRHVLDVYRQHGGRAKRKAVAEHFKLSKSTASKHIKEARKREALDG